ncbi:MAG TPA: DUF4012 domain-containing protein [Candidatus Dormibacteraeota bacterium]
MRRRALVIGLVAVLLIAGGGVGTWRLALQMNSLQAQLVAEIASGAQELQAGKQQLASATPSNLAPLSAASAHFTASKRHFSDAEAQAQGSRTLQALGLVPVLGGLYVHPRAQSVLGVAAMGRELADAGESTVAVDAQLLAPGQAGLNAGQRLVSFLQSSGPGLARVRDHLVRAQAAARSVDPGALPSGQRRLFRQTAAEIDQTVAGLDEFARVAPPIAQILGGSGRHTYLFEQVDPAELRGGGGFIGSYSLLDVDRGVLTLGEAKDVFVVDSPYPMPGQPRYIPPPAPLQQAFGHGWVLGDANYSPDFANAAQAGERLLQNETGRTVDGVISIDPSAVAALLSVTGPVPVPQYGTTVSAQTFAEDVFQRLQSAANGNPLTRKDFFPAVATLVLARVNGLPSSQWSRLLTALNQAVTERHLQVYFNDPRAQAVMREVGWTGPTIGPQAGATETLMEVESNLGGSKANHFLTRTYTLDLTVSGNRLDHVLQVGWRNDMPAGYLGGSRSYDVHVRAYLPPEAEAARITDLGPDRVPLDEKPAGAQLLDGWASVPSGGSRSMEVAWATPAPSLERGYTIYWRKQAGTLADRVHIVLHDGGRTFTADTDLGQDRSIVLGAGGVQVRAGAGGGAALPFLGS